MSHELMPSQAELSPSVEQQETVERHGEWVKRQLKKHAPELIVGIGAAVGAAAIDYAVVKDVIASADPAYVRDAILFVLAGHIAKGSGRVLGRVDESMKADLGGRT